MVLVSGVAAVSFAILGCASVPPSADSAADDSVDVVNAGWNGHHDGWNDGYYDWRDDESDSDNPAEPDDSSGEEDADSDSDEGTDEGTDEGAAEGEEAAEGETPVEEEPAAEEPAAEEPVTEEPAAEEPVEEEPVVDETPIEETPAEETPVEEAPVEEAPVEETPVEAPVASTYPMHTNIIATTFWVGEIFNPDLSDGSQVCSTYDSNWAANWSGVSRDVVPSSAGGCAGSPTGGCDGVATFSGDTITDCATEARTAANDYFPSGAAPKENPFYLDLPYDDLNDSTAFGERCDVIPWASADPANCDNGEHSYMKNRWVAITGPNGATCYGQIEDAGPSHDDLYHDKEYVFGSSDAQPAQGEFNNAGMDVSPALNGCLGFSSLNGDGDSVSWQFVDDAQVPAGPWTRIITTSGVSN